MLLFMCQQCMFFVQTSCTVGWLITKKFGSNASLLNVMELCLKIFGLLDVLITYISTAFYILRLSQKVYIIELSANHQKSVIKYKFLHSIVIQLHLCDTFLKSNLCAIIPTTMQKNENEGTKMKTKERTFYFDHNSRLWDTKSTSYSILYSCNHIQSVPDVYGVLIVFWFWNCAWVERQFNKNIYSSLFWKNLYNLITFLVIPEVATKFLVSNGILWVFFTIFCIVSWCFFSISKLQHHSIGKKLCITGLFLGVQFAILKQNGGFQKL